MAIHNIGRVGIIFYESWEKSKTYGYLDYLRDNKDCYMCVKEHIADDNNRPNGADTEHWKIIVDSADLSSVQKAVEDITKLKAKSIAEIDTAKENAINELNTSGFAKTSDLDSKADKSALDELKVIVDNLPTTDNDTIYDDTEIRKLLEAKADKSELDSLKTLVNVPSQTSEFTTDASQIITLRTLRAYIIALMQTISFHTGHNITDLENVANSYLDNTDERLL